MENKDIVEKEETKTNSEETNKVKKHHGLLYWIIVIVGIMFIMYMSYNIGYKVGTLFNSSDSNNSSEKDEEISSFDSTVVSDEINNTFYYMFKMSVTKDDWSKNLFDKVYSRKVLVVNSEDILKNYNETKVDNINNTIYYIDYSDYEKKHKQFFGENYKVEDVDYDNINNSVQSTIGNDKVTWFQAVENNISYNFKASSISYDSKNNEYIIDGIFTYVDISNSENDTEGTFKLSYTKDDKNKYYKSFILTEKN